VREEECVSVRMSAIYEFIGEVFLISVLVFFVLMIISACFALFKRDLFPRFSLALLNFFNRPLKAVMGYFHMNPAIVDRAGVMLMNTVHWDSYLRTPLSRRLLLLPQCLRYSCPASVSPLSGVICECCGSCVIGRMKIICESKGINMRVAPGGEFAKRAIVSENPEAVIGVACENDLYKIMRFAAARGIPAVGVILTRSGCVSTDVDEATLESMLLATAEADEQTIKEHKEHEENERNERCAE